jgi:hypothetical protein
MRAYMSLLLLSAACSSNSISTANGVAACAAVSACNLLGQSDVQACANEVAIINDEQLAALLHIPVSAAQVNCLAAAGPNCDAAKKCLNDGQVPGTCTGSGGQTCNGTVMTSCDSSHGAGFTTTFDCATYGEMCLVGSNRAECGSGTCAATGSTCNGTSIQTCDNNGVYTLFDCAQEGAICIAGPIAVCRGSGPACTASSSADQSLRCDGNVLVNCVNQQEASFDCARTGTQCFDNAKGQHAACALGNTCNPDNYAATCSGTVLSFCNDGKPDTYDCASGGFTTCNPANGGKCQ